MRWGFFGLALFSLISGLWPVALFFAFVWWALGGKKKSDTSTSQEAPSNSSDYSTRQERSEGGFHTEVLSAGDLFQIGKQAKENFDRDRERRQREKLQRLFPWLYR